MIPRISRNAVKEGFDTLPAAICYFDRNGLLRLINHRMQEIAAVLCGRDLQTLTDLEQALRSPGGGVRLRDEAARIYEFPDGTVYHFTVRPVQDKYGIPYTEVMATDVTQLATLHAALQQENERLADANRRAKRLYDNMPDIVREEEILKMKMRVHDDIGHTLLAARRALRHEHDLARLRSEAAKTSEDAAAKSAADADSTANSIKESMTQIAALQKRQNVLVGSETGNPVSCDDAFAAPLCGLYVYGKSTQDGTPSPDTPVPIVSAGDGGSVVVKVTGKNRMPPNLKRGDVVECFVKKNTPITLVFKGDFVSQGGNLLFIGENNENLWFGIDNNKAEHHITLKANATKFQYLLLNNMASENVCLTWNASSPDYEPYREQLLTLPTPNGLPGIPVASGGNYTDPQGQQWLCDEVDLERGVKVLRIDKGAFDATKALAEQSVIRDTPIETPLTPAEIAAYKALTAYAPDTVVQTSDGTGVKLEYQRDVNIAIKKLEDAIASMTAT